MAEASPRERIFAALRDLPADASIDDAIERLLFVARIDEGLAELAAGEGGGHEDVRGAFQERRHSRMARTRTGSTSIDGYCLERRFAIRRYSTRISTVARRSNRPSAQAA